MKKDQKSGPPDKPAGTGRPNPAVDNGDPEATRRLSGQLLFGAQDISEFLFGNSAHRRRVYHLADKHGLPVFHVGSTICALEHNLTRWLAEKGDGAADTTIEPSSRGRAP